MTNFDQVMKAYQASRQWLLSLITDPTGARYGVEKSAAERQSDFEEQLARIANFLDFVGNPEQADRSINGRFGV